MRGTVVVEEESAYQEWLKKQQTFKQLSAQATKGHGDKLDQASGRKMPGLTE
jgi:heme/copper-type cytochrome/quinol oxidase subunit 2